MTRVGGQEALLMGVKLDQEFRLKKWWSIDGRAIQKPTSGRGQRGGEAAGLLMGEPAQVGGGR